MGQHPEVLCSVMALHAYTRLYSGNSYSCRVLEYKLPEFKSCNLYSGTDFYSDTAAIQVELPENGYD